MPAKIIIPPEYQTLLPPPVGQSFTDPAFGTVIKRITAAPQGRWATPEYSSVQAFNCDGTRFLLVSVDHFALYDGDGRFISDLLIGASQRPRWSASDPNCFYFLVGRTVSRYNIETGVSSTLIDFPEYEELDNMGEADISADGDHLVLCGDRRYVFVYQISSGRKFPTLDTEGHPFDSLYIDRLNRVLISWIAKGTGRFQGMELYSTEMEPIRNVTNANSHKCLTTHTDGSPCLVWDTSDEADPDPLCPNGVQKINLLTFQRTCLLPLPWIEITHISAGAGFVIVSTYSAPGGPWREYRDEILLVLLDGSPVKRLAHHRSITRTYEEQAWATVSRDGSKVLFGSNMAAPDTDMVDTYMLLLDDESSVDSPDQICTANQLKS